MQNASTPYSPAGELAVKKLIDLSKEKFGKRKPDPYVDDPVGWTENKLGEHLWSKQKEIAQSVCKNRKTAVHSAHDQGKSHIASRLAAWWIDVHPPGEAFVVSTAPTHAQVDAILWREIGKAHKSGKLAGRVVRSPYPKWYLDDELVGYGRKPADTDETGFQGIHARYVLVIVDEAAGIPPSLWNGIEAITTNADARILAIGNPDDASSQFADMCKASSGWHRIQIDGLASPNIDKQTLAAVLDEVGYGVDEENTEEHEQRESLLAQCPDQREHVPDALRHLLLSAEWIADKARAWGPANPLFEAKVRGQFPQDATNGVIPLGWIRAAQRRWAEHTGQIGELTAVGVDVADEGADSSVMAYRHGERIDSVEVVPPGDLMHTANYVQGVVAPDVATVVDGIGIGSGVVSRLREFGHNVISFVASKATMLRDRSGELKFTNCRSAAWWKMREHLDPSHGSEVQLPDDEDLAAELAAPGWESKPGGKIQVEAKAELRKRLGRSTDRADAVIQSWWTEAERAAVIRSPVEAERNGRRQMTAVGSRLSQRMPRVSDRKPAWQRRARR